MLAFLLGGARSGKSSLGQRLAAAAAGGAPVTVVVTAEPGDAEMVDRIGRHRASRDASWPTVEAPRSLADACAALPVDAVVLVDCLSFWAANRVMDGDAESDVVGEAARFAAWAAAHPRWVVAVSNEVGGGVVPDNELARRFRDVLGRVNATVAARAERSWLVAAGRVTRSRPRRSRCERVPVGPVVPDARPGRRDGHRSPGSRRHAVPWFGVVGALVGAWTAAVYALARWAVPSTAAATVAVTAAVVITGAFHEDGLADSADALWGGYDADRRLAILKDSRHGTFGVAALVLALVLRIALLASLGPAAAVGALVAAGALGRGAAVVLMATTRPARPDGLGASYVRALRPLAAAAGLVVAVALGAAGLAGWVLVAAPGALMGALLVRRLAVAKLGGIVGDVLGAAEQMGELAVLAVAATVVHHRGHAFGWWPR